MAPSGSETTTTSAVAATGLRARITPLVSRVMATKPVRVIRRYGDRRGPLLAAGLSFRAVFALFAALWVAFSIAGLVIASSPEYTAAVLDLIAGIVPGLIDQGSGGAITADDLFAARVFTWTGAVALVGTLVTTVGWLGAARDAVREIAQLPKLPANPALLWARDLGLAVLFGVAVLVSAALSLASTTALDALFDALGIDGDSTTATVAARVLGLAIMFAFDTAVLAALFSVLAGVPIPRTPLWQGAVLGAAALGVLKVLGTTLLGGTSNPLLASFAVIIGLLVWFNLVSQVIVIAAAWVVVSAEDLGVPLDPIGDRERREQEARLRAELETEIRAELEAELPAAVRWLARRTRRKRDTV